MRWTWTAVAVLAASVAAQDFKGKTKELKSDDGSVSITVPVNWRTGTPSGSFVIDSTGPGANLRVAFEKGQADVDRQRDRYLEYDSAKYPGAEIKKMSGDPCFGYRLDHAERDVVIVRAFKAAGDDGYVAMIQAKLKHYEGMYANRNLAVLASLQITGAAASKGSSGSSGGDRRVYDATGTASFAAPAIWRIQKPADDGEIIRLALRGKSTQPQLRLLRWEGVGTTPSLLISKVASQWKKTYADVSTELQQDGNLIVRNRKPGWIDYVMATAPGSQGYTLILSSRHGVFDQHKPLADKAFTTLVFANSPYAPAAEVPGDISDEYRDMAVVHVGAAHAASLKVVAKEVAGFAKEWKRIAIGNVKKQPPLRVVVVDPKEFEQATNGFGEAPAAYDRMRCFVVVQPPPDDETERARWRGRLFAALAEASLHRGIESGLPEWFIVGMSYCMDAAGRTGGQAKEYHPALTDIVVAEVESERFHSFEQIMALTAAQLRGAAAKDRAIAWGYTHLALFGGGPIKAGYRKWTKDLMKAKKGPPPLTLKEGVDSRVEFANYIKKTMAKAK